MCCYYLTFSGAMETKIANLMHQCKQSECGITVYDVEMTSNIVGQMLYFFGIVMVSILPLGIVQ